MQPSFRRVHVGPLCQVQGNEQRFPGAADDIRAFLDEPFGANEFADDSDDDNSVVCSDSGDEAVNEDPHTVFPRLARVRCNLTALSQRYNLYFTAYQDRIYVYRPSHGLKILPSPSLILRPPRTRMAKFLGGVLSRSFGHQVNQLVVGDLGDLEILALCYDDGDVMAFFIHSIVRCIAQTRSDCHRRTPLGEPGPFLHENVGLSAWGLAIHKQSRLIAVSSNRHEVTVFAFAAKSGKEAAEVDAELDNSPKAWSGHTALRLEKHFQSRTRTWRIVLPLGPSGQNIPNITFADADRGEAEKVIAVDIHGNTWFLDMWKIGTNPVLYPATVSRRADHATYMGWGVLALPDESFRTTRTYHETFGVPREEIVLLSNPSSPGVDCWTDITCSLFYVPDAADPPENLLRGRHSVSYSELHAKYSSKIGEQNDSMESEDEYDELIDGPMLSASSFRGFESLRTSWASIDQNPPPAGSSIDEGLEGMQGFRFARTIVPSLGQVFAPLNGTHKMFLEIITNSVSRKKATTPLDFTNVNMTRRMAKNLTILRTTGTDVELQTLDPRISGIVCKDVLVQYRHGPQASNAPQPFDMERGTAQRISMLCHVPALNLVVLGSLTGRVALLTLTKTHKRRADGVPIRKGFRVDCILPRVQEEEARLRPWAALHGIAISPLPDPGAKGLDLLRQPAVTGTNCSHVALSRRYRLILHYSDHTILMYSIERSADENILIF